MASQTKLSVVIEAQDKASRVFKELNSHLETTSKKMGAIGRSMSMKLTAPIMGVGAVAVKSFADFDQAMTKSTAIMKVTEKQEEEMRKVARNVAKSTAFSHKQVADAYFYLASAGLGANEAMAAMPAVAEFAQAGAFDLATATDLVTDAQSALGMTIKDDSVKNMKNMIKVSDVLVKANTLANATVEQFSTSLTTEAAAAMKTFGMPMEEGVAVLAAFADQGVKGQVAGSGFSRILRLLTKAANDNKKEMSDLGITVYDSQGNLRNMADIVSDLEKALGGMSDEQRTAALESIGFSARVQGVILPLLGTSDAIRQYEKDLRNAGGITKEVSAKQLESFTNQMKIVRDIVIDAAIDIGKILIPYLVILGKKVKELVAKFQELTPAQKKTIVAILAITAAIGPLLIVLGAMASGISAVITILGIILSPIGLVVIAIGLAIAIGKKLIDNWDVFKESLIFIWDTIKTKASEIFEGIKKIIIDTANKVIEAWSNLPENLGYLLGLIGKYIWEKWDEIRNFFTEILPEIINGIVEWFGGLPSKISEKLQSLLEIVRNKIGEIPGIVTKAVKGVKDKITQPFRDAGNWVRNFKLPSIKMPNISGGLSNLSSRIQSGFSAGFGNPFNDFISRPGSAPTTFSSDDTIIGVKNPAALSRGGIITNIYVQGGNYLDREAGEKFATILGKQLNLELRY